MIFNHTKKLEMRSIQIRRPKYNHKTQKIVTEAVAYATPHFFIQLVWSYMDSLWLEHVRPGQIQYFTIEQDRFHCAIEFQQEIPHYRDHWSIKLVNDQFILPESLAIVNLDERFVLCFPNEIKLIQNNEPDWIEKVRVTKVSSWCTSS